MVLWFQSWAPSSDASFCKSCARNLQSQGYKQVLTWEPQDHRYGANQPDYNLDSIINGSHDAYIKQYADDIKASGVPIYLRLMHEMNGDWSPYGDGINGNTPDKYKRAWIHVHDIFVQEGATNVKWVWAPNIGPPGWSPAHSMSSFYPGDTYVDWVGLDGYNWSSVHNDPWRSFDQIFSGSYSEITSVAPSKPLMIAETASEEVGGDKAQWIKDLESVAKSKYPKIKALIWFNQRADGANWPVDSTQGALSAYRQLVADPYFQGDMP
jgi:beta-mannanase